VPAGPPILHYSLLRAVVREGRRSLPPLSSRSPFIVSLRMADNALREAHALEVVTEMPRVGL